MNLVQGSVWNNASSTLSWASKAGGGGGGGGNHQQQQQQQQTQNRCDKVICGSCNLDLHFAVCHFPHPPQERGRRLLG